MRRSSGQRNTRLAAALLAAGLTAAVATGCSSSSSTNSGSKDSLVIASSAPPSSLDPLLASDAVIDEVDVALYDNLVDYDPDGKLVGHLASSYQIAPDAKSITMTLRSAKFHDGSPVTSSDVKYTLDRIKKLNLGVATLIPEYKSVTISSPQKFTINLTSPTNLFLGALSRIYILNSKLVEKHAGSDNGQAWLATHEAGSGPYELKSYQPNQTITFSRFDQHWDPQTKNEIPQITYVVSADSTVQRNDLLAGTTQASENIDPSDLPQFQSGNKYTLTKLPKASGTYVVFNTQHGITADPRVREAIELSYDYQGHLEHLLNGAGTIATSPIPAPLPCRVDVPPTTNLAKARALIKAAHATGDTLTMVFQPIFSEQKDAATALQSELKSVGLNLKLQSTTYQNYLQTLKSPSTTPDLALIYDNPPTADPGSMLYTRYDSKFDGTATNFSQYDNPEVDSLLNQAITTSDQAKACDLYKQVQQKLIANYAVMYIVDHATVVVSRVKFKGLAQYPAHVGWVPQSLRLA